MIEVPTKPITHAYFMETGVVSVVAVDAEDHRIEVGVIGYEGITGVPLIMGDNRAQHSTYMQIGGSGHRIPAGRPARRHCAKARALRALMLKSAHGFMIQTAHTALANGRAKLEQRLARWLLMAHDRMTTDAVPLTHEFLAVMLGVRRAGVTVAIHSFERRGLVDDPARPAHRGQPRRHRAGGGQLLRHAGSGIEAADGRALAIKILAFAARCMVMCAAMLPALFQDWFAARGWRPRAAPAGAGGACAGGAKACCWWRRPAAARPWPASCPA